MVRIRCLSLALLVPVALASSTLTTAVWAADDPQVVASTQPAVDTQAAAPSPVEAPAPKIEVPRLDGVVTGLSKDLTPPAPAAAPETAPVKAAEAPPAFALAAEIADRIARDKNAGTAREDRDSAQKFYEARKGAPLWTSEAGMKPAAEALITEIRKAGDYALSADVFKLPDPVAAGAARSELADAEVTLTFAALKYARHARGGRVDPQALSRFIDRKAQLLPPAKVLEDLASADKPDATLRGFHPQHAQFEKLRQKYLAVKSGTYVLDDPVITPENAKSKKVPVKPTLASIERKLVINMEMWRWMPAFGSYYIQPNIPDFTVRVVKNGHVVHAERIITGKPENMTPIFSDEMRLVVFKPFWNVPESIKYKEMLPQLMRGSSLARSGLRGEINGRPVDTGSVDWSTVDMRQIHIYQPPGEANALGRVKFLFPNRHDVYLHDTPTKGLFASTSRAFSHGCVRVRDPLKLAEVILGNDKNMSRAQIDQLANSGPENNEVKLGSPIPIHLTYFTAWVDDDGKLQTANDIYGHEYRVQLGLEGKTHLIAQPREEKYAPPSAEERRRYAEQRQQKATPVEKWFKEVFNF